MTYQKYGPVRPATIERECSRERGGRQTAPFYTSTDARTAAGEGEPVNTGDFVFVGYLIQEPYWKSWPEREGYRVASIERECHPQFNKFQWNEVGGVDNPTRFLTEMPHLKHLRLEPHECTSRFHKANPGWVVSGYAFPRYFVEQRTLTSVDKKHTILEFGYALKMPRGADDLKLLGYEVLDANDEDWAFHSILNNCDYTIEQVREMAAPE